MTAVLDDTRVFDDIIKHGFGDPPLPPAPPEDDGHGGGGDGGGMSRRMRLIMLALIGLYAAAEIAYTAYLFIFAGR